MKYTEKEEERRKLSSIEAGRRLKQERNLGRGWREMCTVGGMGLKILKIIYIQTVHLFQKELLIPERVQEPTDFRTPQTWTQQWQRREDH